MKKEAYITPMTDIVVALPHEHILGESKYSIKGEGGTDGTIDITGAQSGGEDPDEIFGKDGSNMWDGWDD